MRSFVVAVLTSILLSCGSNNEPAKSAVNCTNKGANTGVAGAKTGVTTGVAGVKQVGKAVGGFVEGGSDEAKKQWQEGKAETKRTAHEGADETKSASKTPDCP
jgi:hypothetical protein